MNATSASADTLNALLSWQFLVYLAGLFTLGQFCAIGYARLFRPWVHEKVTEVWLWAMGAAMLVFSAWAWAWVTIWHHRPGSEGTWLALMLGALSTHIGLLFFTVGRANRLRLQLEVLDATSARSEAAAAFVAARLDTIGSHKPRGLQAPRGSDVSTLPEDALSTLPEGKLGAAVYRLLRQLLTITPWYARVVLLDRETVSVQLERFWKTYASTVIFRHELGLDVARHETPAAIDDECRQRDLLTAAAVFLLVKLSEIHTILSKGLCGATKWRSVACQVLAAAPPWEQDEHAHRELLARAVEKDPGNYAAWLAYYMARGGRNAVGDVEMEYQRVTRLQGLRGRLEQFSQAGDDGYLALRMRTLNSEAVACLNALRQEPDVRRRGSLLTQAKETVTQLKITARDVMIRRRKDVGEGLGRFAEEMWPTACLLSTFLDYLYHVGPAAAFPVDAALPLQRVPGRAYPGDLWTPAGIESPRADSQRQLVEALDRIEDPDKTEVPGRVQTRGAVQVPQKVKAPDKWSLPSLTDHYNRGCLKAIAEKADDALADLDLAVGLEQIRSFAPSDPYLAPLWADIRFAALLLDGDRTLAHIEVLKPHAARLAEDGVRYPEDLLTRDDDEELARTLNVPVQTVKWMRGICLLAASCPTRFERVTWTNLLTREDIDSPRALRDEVSRIGPSDLARRLRLRAIEAHSVAPDQQQLRQWVEQLPGVLLSATPNWRTSPPAPDVNL